MEYSEKIKSKNWKERQEAYLELGNHFKEGRHLDILYLLQNETNIPALETAIDSILKAPIISTSQVSKIFLQIGNNKTSIKNRIFNLIENIKDSDLIPELVSLLSNKNPKIVINIIISIIEWYNRNNKIYKEVLESLNIILNHSDNTVRSEGMKLTILIYKIVGNDIRNYLNIKPILLKELEEHFNKINPVIKEVKDFDISKIDDPKWNIRLEVLTDILNSKDFNKIDILYNKINDPNNQVFYTLLEIIKKFKINNNKIISGLIERLKDKKQNLTNKIKETLIHLDIKKIDVTFFRSKSPELKCNIIEICQKLKIADLEIIEEIIKCSKDGNGQVRKQAIEALNVLEFNKEILNKDLIKKLNEQKNDVNLKEECKNNNIDNINSTNNINNSTYNNINNNINNNIDYDNIESTNNIKNSTNNNNSTNNIKNSTNNIKNIKNINSTNTNNNKNINIKNIINRKGCPQADKEILESFFDKYPILQDKLWTVRLEFIKSNINLFINEDILLFTKFLYNVRDANFQVNILYIDILISRKQQICKDFVVQEIIIYFCIDKSTELKMRNQILELLRILDRSLVIEIFVEEICKIKKGKKFIELIKIIKDYQKNEKKIEEILKIPVTGIQEKKVLEELKKTLELENEKEEEKSNVADDVTINITDSSMNDTNNISKNEQDTDDINNISKNDTNEKSISEIIKDYLIRDVQSTFFNSLLIDCIIKKYILSESECHSLVSHFITKNFYEEFFMIDRVYPVTKLFLVLKNIYDENSKEWIIKLLEKYVKDLDRDKIIYNLKNSKDFLEFIEFKNEIVPKFNTCTFSTPKKSTTYKFIDDNIYSEGNINIYSEFFDNKNIQEGNINIEDNNIKDINYSSKEDNKNKEDINYINIEDSLICPNIKNEDIEELDIEESLDCLNLSQTRFTPDLKKFRKDFLSPKKNIENLEDILDNIIDSDQNKSEEAFKKLSVIIDSNINSILFSANSIISSISIQLLDVIHRPNYAKLILNVLLKLSQSKTFCEQVRKETLESVNIDLINIIRNNEISDIVSDILTNLCLNSKMSQILEVFLNLLDKPFLVKNEIPLKLVWRHSKSLDLKNTEEIQKILQILEDFYKKTIWSNLLENITTFKIVILHLREICIFYQKNVKRFKLGNYCKKIIEKIFNDEEVNVNTIRIKK